MKKERQTERDRENFATIIFYPTRLLKIHSYNKRVEIKNRSITVRRIIQRTIINFHVFVTSQNKMSGANEQYMLSVYPRTHKQQSRQATGILHFNAQIYYNFSID